MIEITVSFNAQEPIFINEWDATEIAEQIYAQLMGWD